MTLLNFVITTIDPHYNAEGNLGPNAEQLPNHNTTELELEVNIPPASECEMPKCMKKESNMKNDQKYPFITETADLASGCI